MKSVIGLALVILALAAPPTQADPVAKATQGGITVTLYNDPCTVPAVVNLPYRAIWNEAGKNFEGCYDVRPPGIVVLYSDDQTVALLPLQAFGPVGSI